MSSEIKSYVGLFMGIFNLILWTIPIIGIVFALIATYIGIEQLKNHKIISIFTLIIALIGIVLIILNILFWQLEVTIDINVN